MNDEHTVLAVVSMLVLVLLYGVYLVTIDVIGGFTLVFIALLVLTAYSTGDF